VCVGNVECEKFDSMLDVSRICGIGRSIFLFGAYVLMGNGTYGRYESYVFSETPLQRLLYCLTSDQRPATSDQRPADQRPPDQRQILLFDIFVVGGRLHLQ
jgi:hypothetical protein